jgi:cytochrome b involved in lipid metabolism
LPSNNKKSNFSLSEVANHNTVSDCWLIIKGKVYDVTDYIDKHPGGKGLSSFCGKDASDAFATKGNKNKPHSQEAEEILSTLFIGELGQ